MGTARQIDRDYVTTGKVRVVFKNHAQLGPESAPSAEAALCAVDQNKFWEFNDSLSEWLAAGNRGAFAKANYIALAGQLGLNATTFGQCLDAGKYAQQVKDETAESERRGVTATPTFFVNEVKIIGAQPYEVFKAAIDKELSKP